MKTQKKKAAALNWKRRGKKWLSWKGRHVAAPCESRVVLVRKAKKKKKKFLDVTEKDRVACSPLLFLCLSLESKTEERESVVADSGGTGRTSTTVRGDGVALVVGEAVLRLSLLLGHHVERVHAALGGG